MAEFRYANSACDFYQQGVVFSRNRMHDAAAAAFRQAVEYVAEGAYGKDLEAQIARTTHLAHIERERAHNELRRIAYRPSLPQADTLETARGFLEESIALLTGKLAVAQATPYFPRLRTELGATYTVAAQHTGFALFEAPTTNSPERLSLATRMRYFFERAATSYEAGNNSFYATRGALIEAHYTRHLLGQPVSGIARRALRCAFSGSSTYNQARAIGEIVKRMPLICQPRRAKAIYWQI